jgi:hypothetical protein
VPVEFDDYLAAEDAAPVQQQRCEACGGTDRPCWRLPDDMTVCDTCARGFHAGDLTEQRMLRVLLGGTVKAALDAVVSAGQIRATVEQAIDEWVQVQVGHMRAGLPHLPAGELEAKVREAEQEWRA